MDPGSIIPQFGNLAWTVVFFVIALSVIVTIHELGHYLVGRWTGIGAEVFSVGFGPVLVSRTDRHGTRWQIAAFPFGGYVKFVGDANAASAPDAEALAGMDAQTRRRSVHGAPLWARAATVAAGPVFNFLLAILVFAGMMAWQGAPATPLRVAEVHAMPGQTAGEGLRRGDVILAIEGRDATTEAALAETLKALPDTPALSYTVERDGRRMEVVAPHVAPPLVGSVMMNSAAEDAGLKAGDVVLSIDGAPVATFADLMKRTAESQGQPLLLRIWRDGAESEFTLVPRETDLPTGGGGFERRYLIGLSSGPLVEGETEFPGLWRALEYGALQTWEVGVTSLSGLWHMVNGMISTCNIQGPIGIAETSGQAAAAGLASFVMFIGFLSAAVGLMNLFPVPVLDGGHLVFHAWEALTGSPPGERAMQVLMSIGLVLIVGLMLFALTNDLRC